MQAFCGARHAAPSRCRTHKKVHVHAHLLTSIARPKIASELDALRGSVRLARQPASPMRRDSWRRFSRADLCSHHGDFGSAGPNAPMFPHGHIAVRACSRNVGAGAQRSLVRSWPIWGQAHASRCACGVVAHAQQGRDSKPRSVPLGIPPLGSRHATTGTMSGPPPGTADPWSSLERVVGQRHRFARIRSPRAACSRGAHAG